MIIMNTDNINYKYFLYNIYIYEMNKNNSK